MSARLAVVASASALSAAFATIGDVPRRVILAGNLKQYNHTTYTAQPGDVGDPTGMGGAIIDGFWFFVMDSPWKRFIP